MSFAEGLVHNQALVMYMYIHVHYHIQAETKSEEVRRL